VIDLHLAADKAPEELGKVDAGLLQRQVGTGVLDDGVHLEPMRMMPLSCSSRSTSASVKAAIRTGQNWRRHGGSWRFASGS
jgi:hypothetical protein